ncbi:MAG: B12-binding domain-containing radical SAM protein [Acetobacteraceae bacterium]|nr:B12-binding domain-containing radical SAM protein [Acetobacteraceae bacterium]
MSRHRPVALVNPPDLDAVYHNVVAVSEHLGLSYIAAVLRREGIPVVLVDADALRLDEAEAIRRTLACEPAMVGITLTFRTVDPAYRIAGRVKAASPDTHVTVGGQHATFAFREMLGECPALDSVVRGEGEMTALELARAVLTGSPLEGIKGLAYRDGADGVALSPPRPLVKDLDRLPFPARDTLDELIASQGAFPLVSVLWTRGCPGACTFCNTHSFYRLGGGPAWRARSVGNILAELEQLGARYGLRYIYTTDDNFIGPGELGRSWVIGLAQALIDRDLGISFEVDTRADSLDEELLALLRQAGLASAFIGLEAGTQRLLDTWGKGTSVEENQTAVALLRRHGILYSMAGFIMFSPYGTLEDVAENTRFLLRLDNATYWNISQSLRLFPGARIIEQLRRDGLLLPNYSHSMAYGYRFRDPRVGALAQAIRLNYGLEASSADALHDYVQITTLLFERRLAKMGLAGIDGPDLAGFRQATAACLREMYQANASLVLDGVALAEAGWNPASFNARAALHRGQLAEITDRTKEAFQRYLDSVVALLGGAA